MATAHPLCFLSSRQYAVWQEAARQSPPGGSSYCTDCTAAYQQRMRAAQRCAHPGTRFAVDDDGFIAGRRPVAERTRPSEGA